MSIQIDAFFKESYTKYFKGCDIVCVFNTLDSVLKVVTSEVLLESANIVKTAFTVNVTYSDCYDRLKEAIILRFPNDEDIDKFIVSIVLRVLISLDSQSVDAFIQKPRNFLKEVASKHFRIPEERVTEEMINEVRLASDNFTDNKYALEEPRVDSWDEYFFNICKQVARNSKCLSHRIGAILVRDKSIISTGYNGPPRGVPRCDLRWKIDPILAEKYIELSQNMKNTDVEGKCPRRVLGFKSGEGLDICVAGHAERNALINAARHGIATKDTSLYLTCGIPCSPCLVEIINAGVKEIVLTSLKTYDSTSIYLLNQSNIDIRMYDFIK